LRERREGAAFIFLKFLAVTRHDSRM
jgi:hypothetical protein